MAQYKVLSDRLTDVTAGSTVDDMQLEGLNIEALIEGGHIEAINALTTDCIQTTDLESFTRIINQHEVLLSSILNTETVKAALFPDFDGAIKSLGAWGGDFVLVVSKENPSSYFIDKGYETVIAYDDMIL